MTNMIRPQSLYASVIFTSEEVATDLRDGCPDSVALFEEFDQAARDQLALDPSTSVYARSPTRMPQRRSRG